SSLTTGVASLKWFRDSKRIALISWVWPDLATDRAQGERLRERKEDKVKAHISERMMVRYWYHWIADGREPHVMAVDVATGRTRTLVPKWDHGPTAVTWGADSHTLFFAAEDRARQPIWRLGLSDAAPTAITRDGHVQAFALSADGARIVFVRSTISTPPAAF